MAESSKRPADGDEKSATAKRLSVHREKTKKAMGRLRKTLHMSEAETALSVLEQAAQYIEYAEQKENRMPGFRPMADLLPKPVQPKEPISDSVLTLLKLCCNTDFDMNWDQTMHGGPEIVNAQLGKLVNDFGSMDNFYESAFEDLEMLVQVKIEPSLHHYARIMAIAFACKHAGRVELQPGMVRREMTESGKQAEQAITQWTNRKKTTLKQQNCI
jgi:hypothetical protein